MRVHRFIASLLLPFLAAAAASTAAGQSQGGERLRQETLQTVRNRLTPLLSQYCKDSCAIASLKAEIDEQASEDMDLGFEGVSAPEAPPTVTVGKVSCIIQVDDRVSSVNRDRLLTILQTNLQDLGSAVEISWRSVTLPQVGLAGAKEEQLKHLLEVRLTRAINKVIDNYCPDTCVLSHIAIDGRLVSADEAANVPPEQLLRDKAGEGLLRIDQIDAEVAMDAGLSKEMRVKIANVLDAKTRFAAPVNIDISVTEFPASFARQREADDKNEHDPFGMERLRAMLKMLREFSGTKEVITTSTSKEIAETKSNSNSNSSSQLNSSSRDSAHDDSGAKTAPWQWAVYVAAVLLFVAVALLVALRFTGASRDARLMMMEAAQARSAPSRRGERSSGDDEAPSGGALPKAPVTTSERQEITLRLKAEALRAELVQTFVQQPRLAKDIFTRLLQEEGVEAVARYVHLFGQLVVFELISDQSLHQELYELSEYYQDAAFAFAPAEELSLLTALKGRVTAGEIRLLTRRDRHQFDFLQSLEPRQIFALLSDESLQVQAVVLTQLEGKRRQAVFNHYSGVAKVVLMQELCKEGWAPKEFMAQAATQLQRKIAASPQFAAQNLHADDIVFELIDQASMAEQHALMASLSAASPETARLLKGKLVTVEALPLLAPRQLLDLMLSLEREDLLAFLAGASRQLQRLLLAHAPQELAESWAEELAQVAAVPGPRFQQAQTKILERLRSLASAGAIDLLAINEQVFAGTDAAAA